MKTTSAYAAIALALASSCAPPPTEAFSIRQALAAARGGRGRSSGGATHREAALVDSSSTAGAAAFASSELAFLDEPRLYTQQQHQHVQVRTSAPLSPLPSESNFRLIRSAPSSEKGRLDPLEIPRHVESDLAKAKMVMSLEMLLGRAAMVASVALFVGEMTTGQSLPDQLSAML
jgi:hypothetical protein